MSLFSATTTARLASASLLLAGATAQTTSASQSSDPNPTIVIALSILFGVLALSLTWVIYLWCRLNNCCNRGNRAQAHPHLAAPTTTTASPPVLVTGPAVNSPIVLTVS